MLHVALFYTILSLAMECPTQITQIMYLIQKHFFSEFRFTEFLGKKQYIVYTTYERTSSKFTCG